ncbi:MAG: hypothetical protein NVV60_11875 [Luteimonas sp.]|nr:hypothetical protein [Luteimonas sp.]
MTDRTELRELHRLHSDGQSKYTYFLLAAAGAAMGYALQKLDGLALSWDVSLGLIAVAFWLASFLCGCKRISWVHSSIYANYALLQLQHGLHPEQPPHPQALQAAMAGTQSAIKRNAGTARIYYRLQFWLLALGVVAFIAWRIVEMWRLTNAP